MNSSSAHPGPNAPLSDACGNSSQPAATAHAAFKQWTDAGCPASKLLLGLPLYGYVSKSSATHLSGGYKNEIATSTKAKRQFRTSNVRTDVAAKAAGDLSHWDGQQIPFKSLISGGALKKNKDGTYTGANGYTRGKSCLSKSPLTFDSTCLDLGWDSCSSTPVSSASTFVLALFLTHSP